MDTQPAATVIADLAAELEIPQDGTLSRVLYKDDNIRLVLFGFDTDQELTEHTASMPAILLATRPPPPPCTRSHPEAPSSLSCPA